ncbi:MAG: hypothetical protein WC475_04130 [Candidatus Paceibacterota bacterium]
MTDKSCPKCHGAGMVKEKDGSIHTCWDCLQNGNMDQHSRTVRESNIKV